MHDHAWLPSPHPPLTHTVLWCCSVQSRAVCACGIITGEQSGWHNLSLLYSAPGISTQLQFPVFQITLRHHFKLPLLHTHAHISGDRQGSRTRVLRWHHCISAIPPNTCRQTFKQWHRVFTTAWFSHGKKNCLQPQGSQNVPSLQHTDTAEQSKEWQSQKTRGTAEDRNKHRKTEIDLVSEWCNNLVILLIIKKQGKNKMVQCKWFTL